MPALRIGWPALVLILLGGCQGAGPRQYQHTADALHLTREQVQGGQFSHQVYLNPAAASAAAGPLHLYIDGDGIPWRGRGRPAIDPTPHNPLVLRLMAQDPGPAAYLGRPCYLDANAADTCHPWLWTHGRYSEAVVASMTAAASRLVQRHGAGELVLIGYSGGGSLAMLMAPRLGAVTDVVTLAANLDLRSWVRAHGYSPLAGSLDPALQPPLPAHIRQWHWVGENDRQVPPSVVRQGLSAQPPGRLEVIPGLDHACCWETVWPGLLRRVTDAGRVTLQ